jgi:hypothetical protein
MWMCFYNDYVPLKKKKIYVTFEKKIVFHKDCFEQIELVFSYFSLTSNIHRLLLFFN